MEISSTTTALTVSEDGVTEHTKVTLTTKWTCIRPDCDGEHHVYVRAA
jgi:hypothetical protein